VSFVSVYITEAHPQDEWPVGSKLSLCDQPKTDAARLQLANKLVQDNEYNLPVLVDTMHNAAMKAYSAWPFRYFVIVNGRVALKAMPMPSTGQYQLDGSDIRACLQAL